MNLEKIFVYIISIYLGGFIFFSYILGIDRFFLAGGLVLLILYTVVRKFKKEEIKLKIHKNDIILVLLILWMIITMVYSIDFDLSLRYIQIFIMLFLMKILIQNFENEYFKILINVILALSSIHILATHIYTVYPEFILKINSLFMTAEQYAYNKSLMKYGINAGICYEHAANAIYITLFVMIIFSRILISENKKFVSYLFLIIGIVALMYTGKRGIAIANLLAIIVSAIFYLKREGKIVKKIFNYTFILCIIVFVVLQFPSTQVLIERFVGTTLLNGREDIYSKVEENLEENFILGSGINTTQVVTGGNDAHNTYLQILSEMGIIGAILYIVLFAYNYLNAIKLDNKNNKENDVYLVISLYYQTFFLAYSMSGNPLYNPVSILIYFIVLIFIQTSTKKEK